jgi:hypothetical protein
MPLPDAPPPKTSRVYQQFAGKLLSTISSTNFDTVKDPVYIDRNSEDEIRRLNLIGQATNMQSQSGPMPGSMKIVSTTITDNTTTVAFSVNQGEVYQLMTLGAEASGVSGNIQYNFYMGGTDTDGATALIRWYYQSSGDNGPIFMGDADFPDMPMFYDENTDLQIKLNGTFTSVKVQIAMIRVR